MPLEPRRQLNSIEYGLRNVALTGEDVSGDLHVVAALPDGALVAAVDGLGHGHEAALASREAESILQEHARDSLISLVVRCHERLRRTRGVVMSLATINTLDQTLTWLCVGNVTGVVYRADLGADPRRESILMGSGVVGYRLPPLIPRTLPIHAGDTLVFATDGIQPEFAYELEPLDDPQRTADRISSRYSKNADDSLVLVVRYTGSGP